MNLTQFKNTLLIALSALLLSCGGGGSGSSAAAKPNILFVIMDDVGIDQMQSFGYGGGTAPNMPNINAVAAAGVRFRNTWSMPECSPGRAAAFVGRYPLRTNIYAAIGQNDLANSQLSQYDMTTPKLLKKANYESGLFGKFHLAGPENNQSVNATPAELGWDYFYGWVGGLAGSVDTTAGIANGPTSYNCGYVPGAINGGADAGACYMANNTCQNLASIDPENDPPGKQCIINGGLFKPDEACTNTLPADLDFNKQNAYYVSPLVINSSAGVEEVPLTDSRSRGYRSTIEANAAINWIKGRASNNSINKPWMATLSFTAPHTPMQQAPKNLVSSVVGGANNLDCKNTVDWRILQNQMIEAMDTEFGRLMVETGLATRNQDGSLKYNPAATNTMIVIVGDNGTLGNTVKLPFDLGRAKGSVYQTGVWVPLIVAGPLVSQPNRDIDHMINMVDVYQLFAEIAGIDVKTQVPRTIDSAPLMAYLTNPSQASIRSVNFTQTSYNIQANGRRNGPCVTSGSCTQIPVSKSVCEDNAGVWWGEGYTDASVINPAGNITTPNYEMCWQVNQAKSKAIPTQSLMTILPETQSAVRNNTYKLVSTTVRDYDSGTDDFVLNTTEEFYEINQAADNPKLDKSGDNLMPSSGSWSDTVRSNYDSLLASLNGILASQPACVGDANIDGVVNSEDLSVWESLVSWAKSSIADFNLDGLTDNTDKTTIVNNQGTCDKATSVY